MTGKSWGRWSSPVRKNAVPPRPRAVRCCTLPMLGTLAGQVVPMRRVAVANQKGGVVKTTTVVNLGAGPRADTRHAPGRSGGAHTDDRDHPGAAQPSPPALGGARLPGRSADLAVARDRPGTARPLRRAGHANGDPRERAGGRGAWPQGAGRHLRT